MEIFAFAGFLYVFIFIDYVEIYIIFLQRFARHALYCVLFRSNFYQIVGRSQKNGSFGAIETVLIFERVGLSVVLTIEMLYSYFALLLLTLVHLIQLIFASGLYNMKYLQLWDVMIYLNSILLHNFRCYFSVSCNHMSENL